MRQDIIVNSIGVRAQVQADGGRADGVDGAAAPAAAAAHARGAGMGASAPNQHRTGGAEISTGPLLILTMIVAQWSGSLVLGNGA